MRAAEDTPLVRYMRRVNETSPGLGAAGDRAHAHGRRAGWHLFWFFVAAVLVGSALLIADTATAQDTPAAECGDAGEHAAPRRATLTHAGESGVWFRGDVVRCLLGDVEELRLLRDRVGLMDERLTLRDDQLRLSREALALGRAAEERATGALEAAVRRARQAEEDRDAWWRSPVLWFTVGAVLTIGLEVAAVALLGAI